MHLALIGLAGLLLVPTARGAEARPDDAAVAAARHDDGRRTSRRLPANLLPSAAGLFAGDNFAPVLVAAPPRPPRPSSTRAKILGTPDTERAPGADGGAGSRAGR